MALNYCFAEEAKIWIWFAACSIILLLGVSCYNFLSTKSNANTMKSISNGPMQKVRWVKFNNNAPHYNNRIPVKGNNLINAPYSPPRHVPAHRMYVPVKPGVAHPAGFWPFNLSKPYLVKELAMEIMPVKNLRGVKVHAVYKGSNAQKAGLRNGDIIIKLNGKAIQNMKGFKSAIAIAKPESKAKIQILRNGKKMNSKVSIGEGEMEGVTIPVAF